MSLQCTNVWSNQAVGPFIIYFTPEKSIFPVFDPHFLQKRLNFKIMLIFFQKKTKHDRKLKFGTNHLYIMIFKN